MTAAPRRSFPERDLYAPLVAWLIRTRIVRPGALLAEEVFLHGKRIDIALLTGSKSVSTFEIKSNHSSSVLSQANLNRLSADRSYVVTMARPTAPRLDEAKTLGVGWLLVDFAGVHRLAAARRQAPVAEARARLVEQIRRRGQAVPDVQ